MASATEQSSTDSSGTSSSGSSGETPHAPAPAPEAAPTPVANVRTSSPEETLVLTEDVTADVTEITASASNGIFRMNVVSNV